MIRRILLGISMFAVLQAAGQSYADHSVLQEGTWYKIGITRSGMYRLDAAFFTGLGLSPASIDPRQIQLYGNGGAMLPQANSAPRPDDLLEHAIWVAGEADGVFNSGDEVLFYGEGPHIWNYDAESQRFRHVHNLYSDTSFYFLRIGPGTGKRVQQQPSAVPDYQISAVRSLQFHEIDRENPIHSGRYWLGERFDLTTEREYAFGVRALASNGRIRLSIRVAARSDVNTSFAVSCGGVAIGSQTLTPLNVGNVEARYYEARTLSLEVGPERVGADDTLRVKLAYNKAGSNRSEGWLDWIQVEYDQDLDTKGLSQWWGGFAQAAAGQTAGFSIKGDASYRVWNLGSPSSVSEIEYTLAGDRMEFGLQAGTTGRLVVFKGGYLSPASARRIANQDLHGMAIAEYLIISAPDFLSEANRLADFHRSHYGRSVSVVTPAQIYNEFSSGKQDVTAIRDFIRMQYIRSEGLAPNFVLLFGDGSYIYKNIDANLNTAGNFVPTYQSRDSWDPTDSYTSDDYYVMLSAEEGFWGEAAQIEGDATYQVNLMDAAIGRLPAESLTQAKEIVDKIIRYATTPDPADLGQWRNRITLVADHKEGEGNTHVRQANGYTGLIEQANSCIQVEKIYMDNYKMEISAGKTSFPEGRQALLDAFDQGALIFNYTGHGGEAAWSNSDILKNSDIPNFKNEGHYPAVVTATCEYGRFDNPKERTGAELMVMEPDAGAIALFTTVRLVYSSPNELLNQNFYRHVFTYDTLRDRMPTLGEVMMRTKNSTFVRGNLANVNSRNFTLLGDPGLILNYPEQRARITHINGRAAVPGITDSLRSLERIVAEGLIEDPLGNPLPNFEGTMEVTVYDKPSVFTTRLSNYTFSWQKNRIFNGSVDVKDGAFRFEFVVPIDISYEPGKGEISLYFFNTQSDGYGCRSDLHVGGTAPNAVPDDEGPLVRLYLNDSTWQDGGITGPEPFLYAVLRDESGINTVGAGIGHEIAAVLDGNEGNTLVLNNFYTARPNSFQEGEVRYQLRDLEEGEHTLRIRVWDVANNFSEAETRFIVSDNARVALDQILSYPNPFDPGKGPARFLVEHNQDGQEIELRVEIMDLSGRVVKTLSQELTAGGNYTQELEWDGSTANGMLSSGVYLYRVTLRNLETRQEAESISRLVLIR
ncbi:MAG: type IX secretion system sortase PorU [Bacteroidia bacterium]|nr:type IX secretion system sortase PorU [Bacteroidia bacterium]